jgi:hypothetical protein
VVKDGGQDGGHMLEERWSNAGQTAVKSWSNSGRASIPSPPDDSEVRNAGQKLVKYWSNTGQSPVPWSLSRARTSSNTSPSLPSWKLMIVPAAEAVKYLVQKRDDAGLMLVKGLPAAVGFGGENAEPN